MASVLPISLAAQETSGAILRSSGSGTLVNENQAPASTAIFPNDLIQTPKSTMARIEVTGSAAEVSPETVVQYQATELALDHGSLSVNTSRGLRVRVGCITITPVHDNTWTHYDVKDVDGKVTVSALKDDVYIDERSKNVEDVKERERNRSIVRETEQKTREEKCAGAYNEDKKPYTYPLLNSPVAVGIGAGIVIGITCYALCRGDEPISPSHP